jgi:hypothetical protein
MPWTTPRTWATNDSLSASTLNTHLRDNLGFLYTRPAARVYNTASQSIATATFVALTFNSERFDTDSMHSTVTNTGRLTATTAGIYLAGGNILFAANATGVRGLGIRGNGVTLLALQATNARTDGAGTYLSVSTLYQFSAGDYVELVAWQNSGSALNSTVESGNTPEFWATFIGNV